MTYHRVFLVCALADRAFGGNSTAVVIDNGSFDDIQRKEIARDLNQSVCVFVDRLDVGHYKTRFYIPNREIELCGHASIATFFALAQDEYIAPIDDGIKRIWQHTTSGKVELELQYSRGKVKKVFMSLKPSILPRTTTDEEVLDSLGLDPKDVGLNIGDCKIQKISTGLLDVVVPIREITVLQELKPDFKKIYEISKRESIISFHTFTTYDGRHVTQRTFSPSIGVNEESASGTSAGATLYYLHDKNLSDERGILITQGESIERKSDLMAIYDEKTDRIRVGGSSYVFMNGVLKI